MDTVLSIGFFPWFYTLTDTIKETTSGFSNIGKNVLFVNGHLGPRRLVTYYRLNQTKEVATHVRVIRQRGDILPYAMYHSLNIPQDTSKRLRHYLKPGSNVALYRSTSAPSPWEVEALISNLRDRIVVDIVEVLDEGLPVPQHLGVPQLVIAVNKHLAHMTSEKLNCVVPVVPQGVSQEWYSVPSSNFPRIIGYFGNLARLDFPFLLAAARILPDWTIKLVGPGFSEISSSNQKALKELPNIEISGPVYRDQLPFLAQNVAIWWLLLSRTTANEFAAPIKLTQALASGRPVIAPPLQWAMDDENVTVVSEPYECAQKTELLFRSWGMSDATRQQENNKHLTWDKRAGKIAQLVSDGTLLR